MARGKKELTDAFEKLEGQSEQVEVQVPTEAQETPQEASQAPMQETMDASEQQEAEKELTVKDVAEQFKKSYEEKSKKPTVEDTHIRTTFLFRRDLQKRLDKLAKNKRGYKTDFINKAIESLLNEVE